MTLSLVLLQEQLVMVLLLERDLVSWSLAIDERCWHEDLRGSDCRSVITYVHGRMELYCSSLSYLSLFSDRPCEVTPVWTFYSLRSDSYNESQGPTGGLGASQTLCYRAQRLEVSNDVLYSVSNVESFCLIVLLYWTCHVPWCHSVGSYYICSHVQEWSAGSTLHYRVAL
jgi:hypothetical protein